MVTRVDKKPIIYNTTLIRVWKPSIVSGRKKLLEVIREKSVGHSIPAIPIRELLDDFEDVEAGMRLFGVADPAYESLLGVDDDEDDEALRIARMCVMKTDNLRKAFKSAAMMEELSKVQAKILSGAQRVYYGTEAVYKFYSVCINKMVFADNKPPNYCNWVNETTKRVLITQSPYLMIHPTAVGDMANTMCKDLGHDSWYAWDMFKKIETVALRLSSRRNLLAHAFYYGVNKKGFEPSKDIEEDFEIPLTGFTLVKPDITMHLIMGIRYITYGDQVYCLSSDDCVNLATMAQCYYRVESYFCTSNGYKIGDSYKAVTLLRDFATHCCRLIDAGKNFADAIRGLHILAQGDFNDMFEEEMGYDLGWRDRSANYRREAHELDPLAYTFHKRALSLAVDEIDQLNVGFIYHAFVGDEMLISDLRGKVATMKSKVKDADADEWANFINFCKAYLIARFMMTNKRRPKAGGDVSLLNDNWANRCVAGMFTMPPQSDWGKVWIEDEFVYTNFADTWHLDAQDVSYVVKDSEGLMSGKYRDNRNIGSELLMAMTSGNILDTLTGSTPSSARDRICANDPVTEVVLTTAPKAENAKPSWKKRVTFAADCEFRKMQAEYDRNCRKVMMFVRGPSLGVDLCILEKQFADIALATALGTGGGICSHDVSAWSESMDRDRKFEFESILIKMLNVPGMSNIKSDWSKIRATVLKQGSKEVYALDNGSFQGFDGSASTILHSLILIYCMDTARRKSIMTNEVKTNMATLIDDCIALMQGLTKQTDAINFWAHLKTTYLKLGFEIDDLKSIFSTIKAIYLSRRFVVGGEVPADFKVYLKSHISYEDPLRTCMDAASDTMGSLRGAADANGEAWFIYLSAVMSTLAEIAHSNNCVMNIPPPAAAIFALAPGVENGWGIPSIIDWATNDITDKRAHFNAILELLAIHSTASKEFQGGLDVYPRSVGQAILCIKSQAWRMVSLSNIFTNPFEAIREGPLKPDMLKRNAVQDILREVATASPWKDLLAWNVSETTIRVREHLVNSGPLHAPTLAALVNCMPDNYRLSLVGKAIGSQSLLDLLPRAVKSILKRRVNKCALNYFQYSASTYDTCRGEYLAQDVAALSYVEKTTLEREEFYAANGCTMIDHTFPDPVATFTVTGVATGSMISPNLSSLRVWDRKRSNAHRTSQLICGKGVYVPRRSGRVWEITSEYAKGWDSVSQRIAMGLAILARSEADGHKIDGLLSYFIKSWNELSNITPRDTHLISIHGSMKRLDANPGSSTHPIIINRNILRGFNNKLKSSLDVIPIKAKELSGSPSHLHDFLAHETAMLAVTALHFSVYQYHGKLDHSLQFNIACRPDCIIPESQVKMDTSCMSDRINIEIMDGSDNFGLLQSCPELVKEIAIPTMKASWVKMINALVDGDHDSCEALRRDAATTSIDELLEQLSRDEVMYSTAVMLSSEPAIRSSIPVTVLDKLALAPVPEVQRLQGDNYTMSVKTVGSKFSRSVFQEQPDHIMSAIAIRSIVWDRLKTKGTHAIAKIMYMDPDMDITVIGMCKKTDFWRGVVAEVNRMKKGRKLSELIMMGFRSLGVPGIHIKSSDDAKEVTQSVASYFGANLKLVTNLISDQIASIAGRSPKDFEKPLLERIVTNNPALMNNKIRKEHMNSLITYNKDNLRDRIEAIKECKEVHRGDTRSCEHDRHARLVELRCRLYVYNHCSVSELGAVLFDMVGHGKHIFECAKVVAERLKLPHEPLGKVPENLEDTLKFMKHAEGYYNSPRAGWEYDSGSLGTRLAYDTVMADSGHVLKTKFAVSAAELAPRLHKRVMVTQADRVVVEEKAEDIGYIDPFGSDDDDDDLMAMSDDQLATAMKGKTTRLGIPAWHAVYTLLSARIIPASEANAKLGTGIPLNPSGSDIREAHLDDFSDDDLYKAFPTLFGDYLTSGLIFDPEWLNRDEADAYTTDELGRAPGAHLF